MPQSATRALRRPPAGEVLEPGLPGSSAQLMEIVEPIEGKRIRPGCLLWPDEPCREGGNCSAHSSWITAKAAYLRFLEGTHAFGDPGSGELERCCFAPGRAAAPLGATRSAEEARPSTGRAGEACRGRVAAEEERVGFWQDENWRANGAPPTEGGGPLRVVVSKETLGAFIMDMDIHKFDERENR